MIRRIKHSVTVTNILTLLGVGGGKLGKTGKKLEGHSHENMLAERGKIKGLGVCTLKNFEVTPSRASENAFCNPGYKLFHY